MNSVGGLAFTIGSNPSIDRESLKLQCQERIKNLCLKHSGYLFRRLAFFENYPEERPQKSCSFYFPREFSGNVEHGFYFPETPTQSRAKAPLLSGHVALFVGSSSS